MSSEDERESGSSWFCLTCHIQTKRALPMLCSSGFFRVCSGALQVHWGGSLRMTGFVWAFETDSQHSCLCMTFCERVGRCPSELWTDSVTWSRIWTSLEPLFPSAPAAARTPGKTGTVRPTKKKKKRREMECEWMQCLYLCVTFWSFHDFTLCAFMWTAGHGAQSVSSGLHSLPGCFCVPLAVRMRDSAAQTDGVFCIYRENNGRWWKCSIQHLDSRNMYRRDGNCWFKLLSFPCDVLFLAAWSCFHTEVCAFAWKRTGYWENLAGREAWWGKPGVLSGIARYKWFHLSHVSQKILFWVILGASLRFML